MLLEVISGCIETPPLLNPLHLIEVNPDYPAI